MRRLLPLLLILAACGLAWYLLPEAQKPMHAPGDEVVVGEESIEPAPALKQDSEPLTRESLSDQQAPAGKGDAGKLAIGSLEGLHLEPVEWIEEETSWEDYLTEGDFPPDLLQHGESSLEMSLIDSETKDPVSGTVQLWRLNAPENEGWNAGDQMQHQAEAILGTFRADQLPEGEYRLFVLFAKDGSPSGEAFTIAGRSTALTQEVVMPHREGISLAMFRTGGTKVLGVAGEGFQWKDGGSRSEVHFDLEPDWLSRRWPKEPAIMESMAGGGGWGGGHHSSWTSLPKDTFGFLLGERMQDSRGNKTFHRFHVREGDAEAIAVRVRAEGPGRYVGIYMGIEEVLSRIVFPAGGSFRDLTEEISVEVEALPLHQAESGDGPSAQSVLLDVPVKITIDAEGFARFQLTWKMREGHLPELALRLADASSD